MKSRLKYLREHLDMNQRDFSKSINISQSTLALMESGQRQIRDIHISQICSEFNVNEQWLRTGEGEMLNKQTSFSLDEYAKKSQLTELDIEIVKIYMDMDPAVRKQFMTKIKNMFVKSEEETAASIEPTPEEIAEENVDEEIEAELKNYRQELEAEKKGRILPAYAERKETEKEEKIGSQRRSKFIN